jgi:hypothetical protein
VKREPGFGALLFDGILGIIDGHQAASGSDG